MAKYGLPCISCGVQLENVDADVQTNQPYNGTSFISHGHYGSTAYDPMDGHFLEINICDACLMLHKNRVLEGRDSRPIMEDGSVVGTEPTWVEPTPWHPTKKDYEHVLKITVKERDLLPADEIPDSWLDD